MKSLFRLTLIVSILVFVSCGEEKQTAAPVSPDVNVVASGQKTIPVYTEFVGETYGISDIQIQARTTGWILGIHFKEGDFVRKANCCIPSMTRKSGTGLLKPRHSYPGRTV